MSKLSTILDGLIRLLIAAFIVGVAIAALAALWLLIALTPGG